MGLGLNISFGTIELTWSFNSLWIWCFSTTSGTLFGWGPTDDSSQHLGRITFFIITFMFKSCPTELTQVPGVKTHDQHKGRHLPGAQYLSWITEHIYEWHWPGHMCHPAGRSPRITSWVPYNAFFLHSGHLAFVLLSFPLPDNCFCKGKDEKEEGRNSTKEGEKERKKANWEKLSKTKVKLIGKSTYT